MISNAQKMQDAWLNIEVDERAPVEMNYWNELLG